RRPSRDHARRGGRGARAREGRGGSSIVTDETTKAPEETPPGEEEQRQDPAVDPEQGETAITDVGTPQEHASEVVAKREVATFGDPDPPPSREDVKRVLAFLNEVAGGRKLLQ